MATLLYYCMLRTPTGLVHQISRKMMGVSFWHCPSKSCDTSYYIFHAIRDDIHSDHPYFMWACQMMQSFPSLDSRATRGSGPARLSLHSLALDVHASNDAMSCDSIKESDCTGSNCPGMSETVPDLLTLSPVLEAPAICPIAVLMTNYQRNLKWAATLRLDLATVSQYRIHKILICR